MKLQFKDKAGWPLSPGDIILYAFTVGNTSKLRYGKVFELIPQEDSGAPVGDQTCRIRIQGVMDDCDPSKLLSRTSVLCYGDRILLVEPYQVPYPIMALLDVLG